MQVCNNLDALTRTFSSDLAVSEKLFSSSNADRIAELLVFQLWLNNAFEICLTSLAKQKDTRFGSRKEKGGGWTLILAEALRRDLSFIPYCAMRGLLIEAGVSLRRAFEHAGVLTHIWHFPEKVDYMDNTRGAGYEQAFRREGDKAAAEALKARKVAKRFEAMMSGSAATLMYRNLSEFDIHGGTAARLRGTSLKQPSADSCVFTNRMDVCSEEFGDGLTTVTHGHQLLCAEWLNLCTTLGKLTEELREVGRYFLLLAPDAGEPTIILRQEIGRLLARLRNSEAKTERF